MDENMENMENIENMPLDNKNEVIGINKIKKLFDDQYYPSYRENNDFIPKDKLLTVLTDDINSYLATIQPSENISTENEIRLGYILCSQLTLNSSKMNTLLCMLIQISNPNIRIQSYWETISSLHGPMEIANRIEIVNVHKIRIKLIIRPNDKDYSIKKLASTNLYYFAKNSKKVNDYLTNIKLDI
jgi:hypothetical protein